MRNFFLLGLFLGICLSVQHSWGSTQNLVCQPESNLKDRILISLSDSQSGTLVYSPDSEATQTKLALKRGTSPADQAVFTTAYQSGKANIQFIVQIPASQIMTTSIQLVGSLTTQITELQSSETQKLTCTSKLSN